MSRSSTMLMMILMLVPAAAFHSAPRVHVNLRRSKADIACSTTKMSVVKAVSELLSSSTGDIEYDEVRDALKAWTDGIVEIGKVYTDGGDYKAKAIQVIEDNYAFSHESTAGSQLLFKPTKAAEHPFRSNFDEFVSYFVGDGKYSEDQGFAITPWSAVRYDMYGVYIMGNTATVSGNYWFTNANDDSETKVEYTFQFVRVKKPAGKLKIILHHSSIPFSP